MKSGPKGILRRFTGKEWWHPVPFPTLPAVPPGMPFRDNFENDVDYAAAWLEWRTDAIIRLP